MQALLVFQLATQIGCVLSSILLLIIPDFLAILGLLLGIVMIFLNVRISMNSLIFHVGIGICDLSIGAFCVVMGTISITDGDFSWITPFYFVYAAFAIATLSFAIGQLDTIQRARTELFPH